MHSISLGRIELTVLDDGIWRFPARPFFRNVPVREWHGAVDTGNDGKIAVGHNCGLIDTGTELIVVDTGYGDDTHEGATGHLLEELERAGRAPEDVTLVVNTHAHGDHIKRNTVVLEGPRTNAPRPDGRHDYPHRRPTFPRARYHLGRADRRWFEGERGRVHEFGEQIGSLDRAGVLTLVDGDHRLSPETLIHATPGHTPGHSSVIVESCGGTAILLGDVCHHPLHFSHPEWVSAFDTHPELTPRTRKQLFELAIERDALVVCPHALPPGLGHVRRDGRGYRWVEHE